MDVSVSGFSFHGQTFNFYLRDKIENWSIDFPPAKSLLDNGPKEHYFILLPLSRQSMDISERGFYYKLRHGRRVIENAFDIHAGRLQVLLSTAQFICREKFHRCLDEKGCAGELFQE